MFVQVIQGKVNDATGLRRQFDRWETELMPGATGFLGATGGVAKDGTYIGLARFESAAAARRNSERPEQTAWWNETSKYFAGDVTFRDSEDVETFMSGGSDNAGFVQFMIGRCTDRTRLAAIDKQFEKMTNMRPDLIGAVRVWHGGNEFTEAGYFTSEAEARVGEKQEPPAEVATLMTEWQSIAPISRWIDITDPWLVSP